jgi:L-ascorbate metabolism protein UlaG (beta-lactamase superfamily)
MEITWLGHSCFRLKGKEAVIITDPCSPETGYTLSKTKADIVTISHGHPRHSYLTPIEGAYKKINSPGEYELKGVFISGIPTYHDSVEGKELGKNLVFLMELDGVTLCHLGDLGHTLSSKEIEGLGDIGVLFLPVGGVKTIDSTIASEMVRAISPKIVIPMHYKTPVESGDFEPIDKFLKKMGLKEIVPLPKLSITRATFTENTQVMVLSYPEQLK